MTTTLDDHRCGRQPETPEIRLDQTAMVWTRSPRHVVFGVDGGARLASGDHLVRSPRAFYLLTVAAETPLSGEACAAAGCVRYRGDLDLRIPASAPEPTPPPPWRPAA